MLSDATVGQIVVEHKDRLTRFGFNDIEQLLAMQARKIKDINQAENGQEDLSQDFVSMVTSFSPGCTAKGARSARLSASLRHCRMKQAITHIKLDRANLSKNHKMDELAAEHQQVVQAYVEGLIAQKVRQPDKYAAIPETEVSTWRSDRWQPSWYSHAPENPAVLRNEYIQANTNVVVIEPSHTPQFDFWLRISTLVAGHPVLIPISLYERARETLAQFPKRCSGVTRNRRDDQWFATFVVERQGP